MTHRTARFLTRLYPPNWRARYGEEFQTFLESRHVRAIETLNIVASALFERLAGSLATLLYICIMVVAPGGALYAAIGRAPLAQLLTGHRLLWIYWVAIEAAALMIVTAGAVTIAPVVFGIVRSRRPDVVKRLWGPAIFGFLMVLVLAIYAAVPESRSTSWFGNTLSFLGLFADGFARFLGYVVSHSKLRRSLGRRKCLVLAMASWIVIATIISAAYGSLIHYSALGGDLHLGWIGAVLWFIELTYQAVSLRLDFRQIE
jgi:hypothetical protein